MSEVSSTRLRVRAVSHSQFISALAAKLRSSYPQLTPPSWAKFVKTCPARLGPPTDPDWWYTRSASIMRKLALKGSMGLRDFEVNYGGKASTGRKPEKFVPAAGGHVRRILKSLELAGLVERDAKKMRVLSMQGYVLTRKVADELLSSAVSKEPLLSLYVGE